MSDYEVGREGAAMRVVYKYPLPDLVPRWWLDIPPDAHVVLVGHQDRVLTLWIEQDLSAGTTERREFEPVGTGQPIPDRARWVGSTQTNPDGTDYVFHIYEVEP